jgi:hypothetical protein
MSLDTWSPAAGSDEQTYYRTEDDTVSCGSVFYGHATAGVLSCISSQPGHVDLPGGGDCGALVTGWHLFRWSLAEAVESRALLVEVFGGWECLACGRPCYRQGRRGCCSAACELAEYPVDDSVDAEVEA